MSTISKVKELSPTRNYQCFVHVWKDTADHRRHRRLATSGRPCDRAVK